MVEETSARPAVMSRRAARAAFLCAALALGAAVASASTVVKKSLAALCAEAQQIFVGTVTERHSRWTDPQQSGIETLVTFSDVTPLAGSVGAEVTLRFPGGTVGEVREAVAGLPQPQPGDRAVVFVGERATLSPLVGFSQGYFRVVNGPDGPRVLDSEGRPVVRAEGGAVEAAPPGGDPSSALSLGEFLDAVRAELGVR